MESHFVFIFVSASWWVSGRLIYSILLSALERASAFSLPVIPQCEGSHCSAIVELWSCLIIVSDITSCVCESFLFDSTASSRGLQSVKYTIF